MGNTADLAVFLYRVGYTQTSENHVQDDFQHPCNMDWTKQII